MVQEKQQECCGAASRGTTTSFVIRYCLLLMVRFFTAFGAQPRLAVVTKTLEAASGCVETP